MTTAHSPCVPDREGLLAAWRAVLQDMPDDGVRDAMEEVLDGSDPFAPGPALTRAARADLGATVRALDALAISIEAARRSGAVESAERYAALASRIEPAIAAAARSSVQHASAAGLVRDILDRVPAGVLLMDTRTGEILFSNAVAEAITDSLPHVLPCATHEEFVTDATGRRLALADLRNLRHHKRRDDFELTLHRGDRAQTFLAYSSDVSVADGRSPMTVISFFDVSARRHAEEVSRASEADFRSLFDMAPVGIAQAELPSGRFVLVNARMCQLTGHSQGDLIGKTILDIIHPDDRPRAEAQFAALRRGDLGWYEAEQRWSQKDDALAWVQVTVGILRDSNEPSRCLCVVRDISAERRANEALSSAREDLARVAGEVLGAQDEERRRLARELHDGPAQLIVAAGLALARLDGTGASEAHRRLVDEAGALCRDAAQQLRTLTYVLHPPALERGLVPAVKWCSEGFASRSGIATDFRHDDPGRLSRRMELALFRIVQEALSNIQRHAGAESVAIELTHTDEDVVLVVRDDGRGFPEQPRAGVGIAGMRERIRLLGGTLTITGTPGAAEVRATVPFERARGDDTDRP